ncbi:asparagine synthase (glutamine-hydrolyzing) [Amycolatopsis sp. BJA-103]|uniref:asparagine synthase (glutamine-hydrolyzing) n=1 Tax=Amycolatopsis sp. BJA-103 TaxID=1911175 RepID=UPI000C75603F|nr:asparagine synthase (glutamine-hydrolyzing) [Amycolatopsis sp. BJA-103]AUI60300.1 asparagine synthase (glutamine-hydrolyzing) [Amycolatopsis sp. BJA-103]PNE16325.1 asparagine synthase (glutamine-hydrolyzing) [Amycolatopsis sp. BJA-103]
MCGIAGWVDPTRSLRDKGRVVRAMADTLAARGPDSEGVWAGANAVLGHRRLAVMDPEHGEQPMLLSDDRDRPLTVISYSGEVFNHLELRAELELLGHKFRTDTDTEVVLHACLEWETGVAEHLNGMFAFAVWDARRGRLLLVRDRLGVKPLFYAPHGHGVLFASEPKALFASGLITPAVDDDGLRDFLASVRTPGGSLFRGVHEVRPGTMVVVDDRGIREHRYWALRARPHTADVPETVDHVRDLLGDIANRHVRADVPLGALLSGGLDSSALAALGRRSTHGRLRTFSVDFDGQFVPDRLRATPDAPYVRDMVGHCGLDHRDIVLDSAALADPATRQAVVTARDAPATGDMDTSLYLLFQAVRDHATVVISGESADEVFGGYPWFHDPAALATGDYPWRYLTGRSGTYQALLREDVAAALDVATHRENHYRQALAEVPVLPGETGIQRRMREVFHLHLTRWLPDLLDRKDRLSMAVGLEVRVPFCDHRLVEYAFNTPWAHHTFDGQEKSLLRAATADLLPASVVNRTKAPYPITQDVAYDRAIRDQAGDLAATPTAPVWTFLDPQRLRDRLARPVTDRATRAGIDFALNLDLWLSSSSSWSR